MKERFLLLVFKVSLLFYESLQHTPIRLEGGLTKYEGRVEVFHDGEWGTICGRNFDVRNAKVICRMLGQKINHPVVFPTKHFGPGIGTVGLENLACTGTEDDITLCPKAGRWEKTHCGHENDVGISCGVDVRLMNKSSESSVRGRLEILHDNLWGTVCNTNFDVQDAMVVCRMLGFKTPFPKILPISLFGQGDGEIWLGDLNCIGNELDITNCSFPKWGSSCSHSSDIAISCSTEMRLVGGTVPYEGRVEVKHNGNWGTICDDMFDINDAKVVCRTMGYTALFPVIHKNSPFGLNSGLPILMDDLQCIGTETDIAACFFKDWGNSDCSYTESVSITCHPDVRLTGKIEGILEVYMFGQWGTVCADGFGLQEANTACKTLGYESLVDYRATANGNNRILWGNMNCTGITDDIRKCNYSLVDAFQCLSTVYINCGSNGIFLSGGKNSYEGTVNLLHSHAWGSVCDDNFDLNEAYVVCRMMGFYTWSATAYGGGHFPRAYGEPIWLDDLSCSGREATLSNCGSQGWGSHNCGHNEDAGVTCLDGVRLVDGDRKNNGRIEIFRNGKWGTVCDHSFNIYAARLVCRMMRMDTSSPTIYRGAQFGEGLGDQWSVESCSSSSSARTLDRCSVNHSPSSCVGHKQDVGIACGTSGEYVDTINTVRLVNGSTGREGFVELYRDGYWGAVCDSTESQNIARVICKQLGYDTERAESYRVEPVTNSSDTHNHHVYSLSCGGSESRLQRCSFNWGSHTCNDKRYLKVECGVQVRLASSKSSIASGQLEIKNGGSWEVVCPYHFTDNEVRVVCRMLGFDERNIDYRKIQHLGNTSYTKSQFKCSGDESDISLCTFQGWTPDRCDDLALFIECGVPIQLVDGRTKTEGILQMLHFGKWFPVCYHGFDHSTAKIACRSLGYSFESPDIFENRTLNLHKPAAIRDLKCNGSEISMSECTLKEWSYQPCSSVVRLSCSTQARLVGGEYTNEGQIEIKHNGTWGTICADNFDTNAARVVCSLLGFNNPYPEVCIDCFGTKRHHPTITSVNCTGNELDIEQCSYRTLDNFGICNKTVGLYCRSRLRLTGGINPSDGRVEIYHNEKWGSICGENFGLSEARVVCRMLGYDTKNPVITFGNNTNTSIPIWLNNLNCWGTEDDIGQCTFDNWETRNCSHSQDVILSCGIGVRLVGGSIHNEGVIEVLHAGEWGTICNTGFSEIDGHVICRMLGLDTENVTVVASSSYTTSRNPVKISNLECSGIEQHIAACKFDGWGHIKCGSSGAAAIVCGGTKIRLANSKRPSEGRLEVLHNNVWGTVCSDNFDTLDATTVCNILGFKTRYPYAVGQAFFGEGTNRVWLDEVNCNGTEKDIYECRTDGWGKTDCGHSKDVSVFCDTMVKLVNGTKPGNGRVEIFHNGVWGTVCDTSFQQSTATVLCTMLGYNNSNALIQTNGHYGYGKGKIFFTDLRCDGTESDLEYCHYSSWDNNVCGHVNDIGLDCTTRVKLIGGRGPFEGTVEIFHKSRWGEICDNKFDIDDAVVICRMLGYKTSSPSILPSNNQGTGTKWLDQLECNGDETDIALCKSDGFGEKQCGPNKNVRIYCGQDIQVRIQGGKGTYEGNIEILNGSSWTHVCTEGFNMKTAKVVCKTLGFPVTSDPVLLNVSANNTNSTSGKKVTCDGTEGDIGLCQFIDQQSCSPQGIRCPRLDVKLVGSNKPNDGRVEIFHNGQWGTICGDKFEREDGVVICRMLGLEGVEEIATDNRYGQGNGPVLLENLSCGGNENDISGCLINWNVHNCSGNQSAVGIRCATTPLRLIDGGGPWEGRVEVMHNGIWGTICDNGFGQEEAEVVCRMLGFKDGEVTATARNASFFGQSQGSILLDMLSCAGTELDINACRTKEWGYHTCSTTNEAGVVCKTNKIRLSGGTHSMEGRVDVLVNNSWSTICDENWTDDEATTVCKMLTPYPLNRMVIGKAFSSSYFGLGQETALISNLKCNGSEVNLLHCSMNVGGRPHCDHTHDAGISCSLNSTVFLSGTNGENQHGTYQITVQNYTGSLCIDRPTFMDGKVMCKSLGFWSSTATVYTGSWFGRGIGQAFDIMPSCSGHESDILFCPLGKTLGKYNCLHSDDVGIQCTRVKYGIDEIRLSLGNSSGDGRLEIRYNGKWGTVCANNWTDQNSAVVCRMLGYRERDIRTKFVPRGSSLVTLGSLSCIGNETDIGLCKGSFDKTECTDDIVYIDCSGQVEVNLIGGTGPLDGRVDIKMGGKWGSLCDQQQTIAAQEVVCKMKGYSETLPFLYLPSSAEAHRSEFGIDSISCTGLEVNIAQCQITNVSSCHHRYGHLKCFECVEEHVTQSGSISSKHYPGRYDDNTDCLYVIKPPSGLYTLTVDVLQMANTGDYLQIKDSPFGRELGSYSVLSYFPVSISNEFWIRFKTDGRMTARGFKLHWAPFEVKDVLSLNCEIDRWGASINITLLHLANLSVNYSDIYINDPDCYGQIIGDRLVFNQLYNACGTSKNITSIYNIYTNNLTYIVNGTKHTFPLECKIFKDDKKRQLQQVDHKHLDNDIHIFRGSYVNGRFETTENEGLSTYSIKLPSNKESNDIKQCTLIISENYKTLHFPIITEGFPSPRDVQVDDNGDGEILITVPHNTQDDDSYLICEVN